MANQRKSLQKPDLIIDEDLYFSGLYTKEEGKKLIYPTEWTERSTNNDEEKNSWEGYRFPELHLYNIGVGTAKNIKLEWKIKNIKEIADRVNSYCAKNDVPLNMSCYSNAYSVEIEGNELSPHEKESYIVNVNNHNYLLPVSINSSGVKTPIPVSFSNVLLPTLFCLELFAINKRNNYLFVHKRSNREYVGDVGSFTDIVSVELKISYEDVEGFKYSKYYDVKISLLGYLRPSQDIAIRVPVILGVFEFR